MKNIIFATPFVVMCLVGCGSSNTDYEVFYDNDEESVEYESTEDLSALDEGEYIEENLEIKEYENMPSTYTSSYSSSTPTVYLPPITTYNPTYHTNSSYQYEYRTGISGSYNYNYDVSGSDDYGGDVSGNLDMQGKYGGGYIVNTSSEEIEVEAEWTNYGTIEATDYYGNTYELTVD